MLSNRSHKEYIGDSVYASFDGYHIVLTTENGKPDDPSNFICLEPAVFRSLIDYQIRLEKELSNANSRTTD